MGNQIPARFNVRQRGVGLIPVPPQDMRQFRELDPIRGVYEDTSATVRTCGRIGWNSIQGSGFPGKWVRDIGPPHQ